MASKEIDLVLSLVGKGAAAVEKDSHVLWRQDDLLEAQSNLKFQNEDQVMKPNGHTVITSLYPGCLNMIGDTRFLRNLEPIAETSHFLIFGLPGESENESAC
jgi:hypothetical protein